MFYAQVAPGTNIVTDIISYPLPGYAPTPNIEEPLPDGVLSGIYRLEEGALVLDPELNDAALALDARRSSEVLSARAEMEARLSAEFAAAVAAASIAAVDDYTQQLLEEGAL